MKTVCFLAVVAALFLTAGVSAQTVTIGATSATSAAPAATSSGLALFKTEVEKVSYAIGTDIGRRMKAQGIDIDPALVGKGLADAMTDKTVLTDEEMQKIMMDFKNRMIEKHNADMEKLKVEGEKNKTLGEKFLADNKAKDGVQTLPDGLEYKVIKEGTGDIPTSADSVKVNYVGKFLDGTEFDSSIKHGKPVSFQVLGVIPAWTEILQKMKVGSKYEIWVPSALGYGERGNPPVIPPTTTLHFEIELLSIEKASLTPGK